MKIIKTPSPHFNERLCPIDALIIHYTDMLNAEEALAWLINPASQVSAHYLIDEEGLIYQMVEEDRRAWHAGKSFWQGCTNMNSCSIGIELANPGHTHGYIPFPEAQINSLIKISKDIQNRWGIPSSRILGHSDIAPQRKQDPGHLFPWKSLAQEGLGLWPLSTKEEKQDKNFVSLLAEIGYETVSPSHTLLAFQRHFQPHKIDGIADQETYSLLHGLLTTQNKPI
ncbi:MAG: N-acetylmuramoyl-L-alanine amidase [Proteobacteria bacterium]|nr:N-acetylmuramoyl-L-alanine amidase [Pseudomonadota bacterium]